jgi:UDP-N-acetylglucosamine:LPS N-acetylglucosamine transferase
MRKEPLRVVIAGGGTGGHLYPGIAVAREILARAEGSIVTFAGTAHGIETRVVPREGFELDVIRSAGLKGKSLAARAKGALLLPLGSVDAWRLLSATARVRSSGWRPSEAYRRWCSSRTPCLVLRIAGSRALPMRPR